MSDELTDDVSDLSPTLAACLPKERLAIEYRLEGHGFAESCPRAGYGLPGSTPETLAKIGYRLFRRDRVLAALLEEAKKNLRNSAPEALRAVRQILSDEHHRDRFKAISLVLDRSDAVVTKIDATVTHKFDPVKITLELLTGYKKAGWTKEMLLTEFSPFELAHFEGLLAHDAPIEAEYKEVPAPYDEDLADLQRLLGADDGQD
jgi:hypothetical protein